MDGLESGELGLGCPEACRERWRRSECPAGDSVRQVLYLGLGFRNRLRTIAIIVIGSSPLSSTTFAGGGPFDRRYVQASVNVSGVAYVR